MALMMLPTVVVGTASPSCPTECYHKLDFEEFSAGMYIHDQYYLDHGIKIWATAKNSQGWTPDVNSINMEPYSATNPVTLATTPKADFGTNTGTNIRGAPRVFDSRRPSGLSNTNSPYHQPLCAVGQGDTDLGSPNSACPGGGPGQGVGNYNGEWYNCPGMGFVGNILIIQEKNSYSDWEYCPDDAGSGGGWIDFEFSKPVDIMWVQMLDTDESNTPDIHFYYDKEYTTRDTLDTPPTGTLYNFVREQFGKLGSQYPMIITLIFSVDRTVP